MKSPLLLAALVSFSPTPRHQAIPSSLYPARTTIHYFASVTDLEMDCNWGMDCLTGATLFHLTSEYQLGRLGGWEQDGQHGTSVYLLFASTYDSVADAQNALIDCRNAMVAREMTVVPGTVGSFVEGTTGQGNGRITVLAYVKGASEVEAGVMYTTRNHHALTYLMRQVAYALGVSSVSGPIPLTSRDRQDRDRR